MRKLLFLLTAILLNINIKANNTPILSLIGHENIDFNIEIQNAINLGSYEKFYSIINENPKLAIANKDKIVEKLKAIKKIEQEVSKFSEIQCKKFNFFKSLNKPLAVALLTCGFASLVSGLLLSLKIEHRSRTVPINQAAINSYNSLSRAYNNYMSSCAINPSLARIPMPVILNTPPPSPIYNIKNFYKNIFFIEGISVAGITAIWGKIIADNKNIYLNNRIAQETSNMNFFNKNIATIDKCLKLLSDDNMLILLEKMTQESKN